MKEPCIGCDHKEVDEYGHLCNLSCGKRTTWFSYNAGMQEVIDWVNTHIGLWNHGSEWEEKVKEWKSK